MYIQPNSTLRVLNDVHVDPEYHNSLYFVTLADQTTYFTSKTKYTFSELTYQRVNKGVIRVQRKADDMYDCTYMMFRNTSYGNKWFYAFITNVEYVNDITANIYYEIDELQTWLKDFGFRPCFVEREHTGSDNIGDNIVPETIETGEYVFNEYFSVFNATSEADLMTLIVAICDTTTGSNGHLYDGVYGGATLYAFTVDDEDLTWVGNVNTLLDHYQPQPDAILGIYMCPHFLVGRQGSLGSRDRSRIIDIELDDITDSDTLDGYLPKNKKLYTYPYNFMHLDNSNGNDLVIRYEFCEDLTPRLQMFGTFTQPVQVLIRPFKYKGVTSPSSSGYSVKTDNNETLELRSFPICSWNVDSWKAWVAQNSVPTMLSAISKGVGLTALAGVNPVSAGTSALSMVTNIMSQAYTASIQADMSRGSFNNGGANIANKKQSFYYGRMSVTAQMAKVIDDYFSMFGYAVKQVKYPNVHSRQYWNYIKTIGCNIHGDIPADSHRKLCKIFDDGMTFWHDPAHFEDYSQDNAPI